MKEPEIPKTMKQMVVVKRDSDIRNVEFRINTVPVPSPIWGEVLVRMAAAPVHPSDYENWRECNKDKPDGPNPVVEAQKPEACGSEGSGIVVANGGGLPGWQLIGKRVAVINSRDGTFQEYACVPVDKLIALEDELMVENACAAFVNPFTAVGIVETAKKHKSPSFILSAGAGALAKMVNRLSSELNATVVNVVRDKEQVALLEKNGAKFCVDMSDDSWRTALQELIAQLKITVGFDAIAGTQTGTLLSLLPPESYLFNFGKLSEDPVGNVHVQEISYNQKHLLGWSFSNWLQENGGPQGKRYWKTSKLVVRSLFPGSWAHTDFRDCSLETLKSEFLKLYDGGEGFGKAKLRIVFSDEYLRIALKKGSKITVVASSSSVSMGSTSRPIRRKRTCLTS